MKMKPEDFQELKSAVDAVLDRLGREAVVERYEAGAFPRSAETRDLQTRFCWDMLWETGMATREWRKAVYAYLDDSHVLTALKAICPKVERRY